MKVITNTVVIVSGQRYDANTVIENLPQDAAVSLIEMGAAVAYPSDDKPAKAQKQ